MLTPLISFLVKCPLVISRGHFSEEAIQEQTKADSFSAESQGADGVMVREREEGRSRLMTSKPAFSDPDQQLNIYLSHVRLYPLMQHVVTRQFLFFPHFLFPA